MSVAGKEALKPINSMVNGRFAGPSRALDVAPAQVNVKAKTAERMGPVGHEQAIEARAVALLLR